MNAPTPIGLSVVMPLYNEGARITSNVEQTLGVLRLRTRGAALQGRYRAQDYAGCKE